MADEEKPAFSGAVEVRDEVGAQSRSLGLAERNLGPARAERLREDLGNLSSTFRITGSRIDINQVLKELELIGSVLIGECPGMGVPRHRCSTRSSCDTNCACSNEGHVGGSFRRFSRAANPNMAHEFPSVQIGIRRKVNDQVGNFQP
jgi:hypothetical protein